MVDSHVLKNKIVVVESCHPVSKKQKLEKLVTKHGGKVILDSDWLTSQNTYLCLVVQIWQNNVPGKTHLFIETGMNLKAQNVAKTRSVDIVSCDWMLEQEEAQVNTEL